MKKYYNTPECELVLIKNEDVITASDSEIDYGNRGDEVNTPELEW